MMDRTQKVYFAKCIGPTGDPIGAYKVGCSHGWAVRIKQVAYNQPFSLEVEAVVPGSYMMEAAVHIILKEHRIAGEYFRSTPEVVAMVNTAANTGNPFARIKDLGSENLPDEALHALMKFHDVSLAEACEVLGISDKEYKVKAAKPRFKSSRLTAAVAIVAARRGQFVTWPTDAVRGLIGEQNCDVIRRAAKSQVAA